jgi:hypothetical protein
MPRIRMVVAVAAALALAGAGVATAAVTKVTGGTTQITVSSAAQTLLSDNHIAASVIAPATQSGATITFPIAGGRLNAKNLHGAIVHRGGIRFSNGTATVSLRAPTIISKGSGASLYALVRGKTVLHCRRAGVLRHRHVVCTSVVRYRSARLARITKVQVSGSTATGTVAITQVTADAINRLAGKNVAAAGDVLGTVTVTPTLK